MTPEQFMRASEAFKLDLEPVLDRHLDALGGAAGLIVAFVDVLGVVCAKTIAIAPEAQTFIDARLKELELYVAAAGARPQ